MSADPGGMPAQAAAEPADVAIIVALGVEGACFADYLHPARERLVSLHQCGPGAVRAASVAQAAVAQGAKALVSWGLAGGLEPGIESGTVVLPRAIVRPDGARYVAHEAWQAELAATLREHFALTEGQLLAADDVLGTPRLKTRAALASGAVAVDMESAAVADVAGRAGIPFVALRVIADGLADSLPPGVERWIDEAGNRRFAPVVDAALKPVHWRCLMTLARRYRTARRTLDNLARELAPRGLLFGQTPK